MESTSTSTEAEGLTKCRIPAAKQRVVLVGNPGVGKSFLLGLLSGDTDTFKSGFNIGGGLTRYSQSVCDEGDGVEWVDTPGLSDIYNGHKNAEQITLALRRRDYEVDGGAQVCIFVMTLDESGQVRKADVDTMQSIRSAMHMETAQEEPFIIVNKCQSENTSSLKNVMQISQCVHSVRKGITRNDIGEIENIRTFVEEALRISQERKLSWFAESCVVYKDPIAERRLCHELNDAVVEMRQRLKIARRKQVKTRFVYTAVGIALVISAIQAMRQLNVSS